MNFVNSGVIGPKFTKFCTIYRDICRGIIYAVNAHIKVSISHSVSECQSDEKGGLPFFTRSVAMATSLEIMEQEVLIDHLHQKRFHSVKRLQKSVQ